MKTIRCAGRLMSLGSGSTTFLLAILLLPVTASAQSYPVSSESLTVTVTCSPTEVKLTTISGKSGTKDFEYLNGSPSLLSFGLNSDPPNYYNGTFTNVSCNLSGGILNITANSSDGQLAFWFSVAPDGANPVVIVSTQVTYQGSSSSAAAPTAFFRAQFPNVQFYVPNSPTLPGNAMAMVPQMIGTVVPLSNVDSDGLGATYAGDGTNVPPSTFGLPTNLNVMEIAEVYDHGGGGGLYFMDLDGDYAKNIAPLQFNLTGTNTTSSPVYQITGYWTALLKLNQPPGFVQWVTLPSLAIGTHSSGDWHHAVDYYVTKRSPNWTFPNTPGWFRNAGGIYSLGVAGGGSFIGTFPFTAINDSYFGIELFACNSTITVNGMTKTTGTPPNLPGHRCLLDVYNDAQKLGANVLYLTSWWSGGYDNKGDYIADPNLGGETGLATAINQVHNAGKANGVGAYVILYMEPYAAADSSALVSKGPGNTWRAQPEPPIPPSLKPTDICAGANVDCMAMPNTQWQDYLINIVSISDPTETNAINLIKTTGVDGVFLDSWGWQMNWPVGTSSEDVDYTSKEWTAAGLRFVDRFRAAIQLGNPNAIVMGENNTGQLPFHWDGGSAADLSWGPAFTEDAGTLLASPIRYAMPNANFFVNGGNLRGLNQVFAAGHNLALGPFWLTDVLTDGMDAQNFAAYGAYGLAAITTLTTTKHSKSASVPSSASPDLTIGLSISATSVKNGTTIKAIDGTTTSGTSITMSRKATAKASSVPAEFLWPIPQIAAITTLTTTKGSDSASVSASTGLSAGQFISATSVPFDTTIKAIDGTTTSGTSITLSQNATAKGSVPAAFSKKLIPQLAAITTLTTTKHLKSASVPSSASTHLSSGLYISATSVPNGTTITEISGTTVTLSRRANTSASVPAQFLWAPPQPNSVVSDYISFLMNTRQKYADALVSGTQLPMPATTSSDIVAYMYQGQTNQIVTIVNNGSATVKSVKVKLDSNYGTEPWTQILPSTSSPVTITEKSDGEMTLTNVLPVPTSLPTPPPGTVPEMGLVILQRSCPTLPKPYACAAPPTPKSTAEVPLMNETFSFSANGSAPAGNWIDWMVSGTASAPSGRWATVQESYYSGSEHVTTAVLQANSPDDSSLLFYDNFGGGLYFTYSGQVTIVSFTEGQVGQAGLSFRLSDNQVTLDAGNQGYDLVLTNGPMLSSGSVILYKRQPQTGGGGPPILTPLKSVPYTVSTGQTYQLSVTANTTWTNLIPSYPSSTTFTVFVDGVQQFQATDSSSYFSGRFGVNSSNAVANFACLQANGQESTDGPMPTVCPIPPPPTTTPIYPKYPKCGALPNGYNTCM